MDYHDPKRRDALYDLRGTKVEVGDKVVTTYGGPKASSVGLVVREVKDTKYEGGRWYIKTETGRWKTVYEGAQCVVLDRPV